MPDQRFSYDELFRFATAVFEKIGCGKQDAATAATALLAADLRGIDSHGVARLSGYLRLWQTGRINTKATPRILHETLCTALVDGDRGLGLVVAPFAMRVAIEKAKQAGTGWVAVQNSNHFGIAAHYGMMALEHGMIGIAMTNASPLVAPTFSADRMLGTNPICVAVPAGQQPPFVADFATTTAANGKLELLQRKNEPAPEGWIQDQHGRSSTDPHELKKGGSLLPLGSDREHGSHKGYALGGIVDILSGVLSGANYAPWVPPFPAYVPMPEQQPGKGLGHFFGAMRIDAFRPAEEFKEHMDHWIAGFRSCRPTGEADCVLVPGDPEREEQARRRREGIPVFASVVDELKQIAASLDIPFS